MLRRRLFRRGFRFEECGLRIKNRNGSCAVVSNCNAVYTSQSVSTNGSVDTFVVGTVVVIHVDAVVVVHVDAVVIVHVYTIVVVHVYAVVIGNGCCVGVV